MKITRTQLIQIIKESMGRHYQTKSRGYHQISDRTKSMANAAKRQFVKDHPETDVKIDGRQGWIIVNDKKAVNISSADGQQMSIENMVAQMKQTNAGPDADMDGTSDADELRAIADVMDGSSNDAELRAIADMKSSFDSISDNEVGGKLSFYDWVEAQGGKDSFDSLTNVYDAWLAYVNPERYGNVFDDEDPDRSYDNDMVIPEEAVMYESAEFTFDKFMQDINGREDKISQHKKELTENDGDSYARTVQKLYQEDWRNSVKFKGKK